MKSGLSAELTSVEQLRVCAAAQSALAQTNRGDADRFYSPSSRTT